jgi:hypothetical protein
MMGKRGVNCEIVHRKRPKVGHSKNLDRNKKSSSCQSNFLDLIKFLSEVIISYNVGIFTSVLFDSVGEVGDAREGR